MIGLFNPYSSIVPTITLKERKRRSSVCTTHTRAVCRMERLCMILKSIFLTLMFPTQPGQPPICAAELEARKQKPLPVDFDLLLWMFHRYHAEPGVAAQKCKFELFED